MPQLPPLGNRHVIIVMAAEAEYGPHLKARFTRFMTGVGPVEAAMELTAAMATLAQQERLPNLVVPLGFERGITPFLDLPATQPLPLRIPGIPEASLSTGANIALGAAFEAIDADVSDTSNTPRRALDRRRSSSLARKPSISKEIPHINEVFEWHVTPL
ncbi:hypothetical protein [Halomonas organivorans]|uniref:Adenosylhomocysteine nucleosidase n=1 Tax=Halomonas organivorans TaxID=257772 RepID=A0A7W5G3X9_9GAMM|nr:adenosylhomocysteine nucleosidase [Halomonas organivorans]